jgi:xanthine dehydrogenase YagR molybdenum-binding subunit
MSPTDQSNVAMENVKSRMDVRERVTGQAKYTADQYRDKMLFAKYIRFPYGMGRLTRANLENARAVSGVLEIELDVESQSEYVGARVGHVVGESPNAVEDAIEALELRFQSTPATTRPAIEDLPEIDDEAKQRLETLFAEAATVVEAIYDTQVQTHSSLEPHGAMVDYRGDSAEVWGSTQGTFAFLRGLTRPLELSEDKIVVHNEYVGGGFGSKFGPGAEGELAAQVSKKHGRPCMVMLDRREEHLDTGNKPGSIQYMKIAANAEGKVIGGRIHGVSIVGFRPGGGGLKYGNTVNNGELYDWGKLEVSEGQTTLNAGVPRAFRAPGWPQTIFAVDSMMDELAAALSMDPVEFRKKNEKSQRRVKQYAIGAEMIGWSQRQPDGTATGRHRTGFGVSSALWPDWDTPCNAEIVVSRDGRVEVKTGVQDIGTGTKTLVADFVAYRLGIPRERVTVRMGNSTYPEGPGSGGSVVSRSVTAALDDALRKVIEELKAVALGEWGGPAGAGVEFANGAMSRTGTTDRIEWDRLCSLISGGGRITQLGSTRTGRDGKGRTDCVQFARVVVDTDTGIVRVKKVVAVHACGKPVNRLLLENQICGGVIQGVSYALLEDRLLDGPTGGMVNADFINYKLAGTKDIPEIECVLDWEEGEEGVRSIGEPATIPTASAIANAVANAIGARVRSLPITPDRVLAALAQKGEMA